MKCIPLVTAMALALFGAPAWAVPESAEMHVSGAVTAAASCSMSISNDGAVDLGQINYDQLLQNVSMQLSLVERTISVTCDAPTQFALGVFDNRADSLSPARSSCGHCLGLGWTSSHRPIGYFMIGFKFHPIVDGTTRALVYSNDLGSWETRTELLSLTPQAKVPTSEGRRYVAAGAGSAVLAATTMSVVTVIQPWLEGRQTMAISGPTTIDGNATLEIIYL